MFNEEKYIDRYLDDLMPEDESTAFEMRCLKDRDFFERVREREQTRKDAARIVAQADEESFDLKRRNLSESAREWAAALFSHKSAKWAVAAATAVLVILLINRPGYDTNPDLEQQLGARTLRGPTVKAIVPEIGAHVNQSIHFSWESELAEPFEAVVINPRGEEVFSASNLQSGDALDIPLADGLYYWKLLHNGDWLYTGKFILKK
ncbi:hypothetical protein JXA02_06085 [candidate division KSB1 bacterium]|nr:hypothetical protein [candidate division KSB1 bacterium]RQW07558.1 MAG: hypothetical protein EH222_07020 [candidate division KSB1 bacterium]